MSGLFRGAGEKTSGDGALAARLRGDEERPRPSLIPRIADLNHGKPAVVPRHAVDRVAALVRGGQSSRGDAAASTRRSWSLERRGRRFSFLADPAKLEKTREFKVSCVFLRKRLRLIRNSYVVFKHPRLPALLLTVFSLSFPASVPFTIFISTFKT